MLKENTNDIQNEKYHNEFQKNPLIVEQLALRRVINNYLDEISEINFENPLNKPAFKVDINSHKIEFDSIVARARFILGGSFNLSTEDLYEAKIIFLIDCFDELSSISERRIRFIHQMNEVLRGYEEAILSLGKLSHKIDFPSFNIDVANKLYKEIAEIGYLDDVND